MKFILFFRIVTIFFLLQSCSQPNYKLKNQKDKKDTISTLIKKSYDDSFSLNKKLNLLKKAYIITNENVKDSLAPSLLSKIAYRYYQLNDTIEFLKINKEAMKQAFIHLDSFIIADTHWSLGEFYIENEKYDKAYFYYDFAHEYFKELEKNYETGRMLYSMSFVKGRYRDYTGSEVLIFEAIKKFETLQDNKQLFFSYNHLGLLQIDIKEYNMALSYFEKANSYLKELKNKKNYVSWNLNNKGLAHLLNEDYSEAIKYFNKSLENNKKDDLKNYAIIIDNRAIAKLRLKDTLGVKSGLMESLKVRFEIRDNEGILTSKIRISEYYEYINDTTTAIKYAKEANQLAKKIKNGGDYLTTLEQLADLEPHKANEYLHVYSKYSDSLFNADRKTVNKFTRIEFETDEVLEDNKILNQKLVWIFSGSLALILILSLLYFIRAQKAKNEKLFLETEQQKANEQVYLLTLRKQAELEEEKVRERNRISQELHDGILGRLFGTRVGMGFLDFNADEETQKQHEAFLDELQEIEKEIREVSHKLNDNFEDLDVNFTTIINQLLESKSKIGDFKFHLNIDQNISWKSTDEIIKVNVYRIIQETLQNTIKHAQARNVTLDFSTNEQELNVHIKDDGIGFNLKKSKKGIGLKNIRSRIEKLKGTVDILSAPNKGTQIHIKIPIA